MKIKELRSLSGEELLKMNQDLSEDLFRLRFKHGIRRLENPAKLQSLRKDIARIKTILTEKQMDS
ncbi:50S ribosomal protein L29 [Desulfobulbus oligotrophicus]|jgi:large subunit ribosomal protein L29|uniref:Large ribosomal subunit protein uL29 n=1 Tax=Desulfobulbus oligotrophicus TaxID=1909699 RepID=A0A7T5VDG8_9BACT|nr:50S ribosomal protein L29 [Desulfobulbus oligotrophicus]MDY0390370.1 50S ribosomal protein L29 [Desulfobulbus oligotrophicus]QQG65732.1 50S ribosomal protein L29 [Desulfobulbus oligotrophicus]